MEMIGRVGSVVGLALVLWSAGPASALTSTEEALNACNAEAARTKMTGEAYATFMRGCVAPVTSSASSVTPTNRLTERAEKQRACASEVRSRKSEDREAFLKSCLAR